MEEVRRHNKIGDAWLVIDGKVYDISDWTRQHPGGGGVLMSFAGRDASEAFHHIHKSALSK